METPILTKKQLKSTLSAKKNRPKETLKNVLAIPYDTNFWPAISDEDHQTLKEVIAKNLPRIKNETVAIPWDKIKNVPKAERKSYRNELIKDISGQEPIKNKDTCLCLGVNAVTKLLEKNLASAILITANVQPRIMVQHILDQAVLYRVPVLIFDKLKHLLKTHCGVSSIALAIEKNIPPGSSLNSIREHIEKVFAKCPPPENHINYYRSLDPFKKADNMVDESVKKKEMVTVDENEIRKSVYLKKPSNGRAFTPKCVEPAKNILTMEVDEMGFIPFTVEPEIEERKKLKPSYKSLVVKRLKGDKNRSTKKIKSLKTTNT